MGSHELDRLRDLHNGYCSSGSLSKQARWERLCMSR